MREIVGDAAAVHELHDSLRRVELTLPADFQTPITWETLAAELQTHYRVLCIVDRRDDARVLHGLLPVSYTHLDVYKRQALGCGHPWARAAFKSDSVFSARQRMTSS